MNATSAAIFLSIIAGLCLAMWGLFSKGRSVVIGVVAVAIALLAALGAWYAWAESGSAPWSIGYAVIVVLSLASASRQLLGRDSF